MLTRLGTRDGVPAMLIVSGALGFWLGSTAYAQWQVAVETAQVIARLVTYSPDNPFHIYHAKLWTVLHEITAVALRFGMSEITASKMLSGVLGMLSLQALSVLVYAFSGDAFYAVGAMFVVFFSRTAEFGGRYPIALMGTEHTYGAFGLSAIVLAAALLGAGRYRLGGLMLGLAPAIHPSMGVWLFVVVAICLATDFKRLTALLRPALPWFLAGCALTAASLLVHLAAAPEIGPVDRTAADRYLPTLVKYWDGHRQPAHLKNYAVYVNFAAIPLAVTWLLFLRDRLTPASAFLLRFVVVAASLAIAFVFISWAPPEWIPDAIQILMPLRLLNIVSMMFAALLLGLAGLYGRTLAGQIVITVLLLAILLARESLFWTRLPEAMRRIAEGADFAGINVLIGGAAALTIFALVQQWFERTRRDEGARRARASSIVAVARATLVAVVAAYGLLAMRATMPRALKFRDRTHDPVFAAAAAGEGVLLPGQGLRLIQLRTRRPVLLDTSGFDGLPYSMEAAPGAIAILRDVYTIELMSPPSQPPDLTNRLAWEQYSPERWQEIRRRYNVTQVLTDRSWLLDLPVVAETQEMRLYQIP